ncbi:MAG: glycosyltransferase [Limisphaerales bacterium]
MNDKSVCVALVAREETRFLRRAVAGAVWQLEPVDELIVVQDGPAHPAPADDLAVFLPRLRQLTNPVRSGLCSARNRAIQATQAEWMIFPEDGDVLAPFAIASLRGTQPEVPPQIMALTGGGHWWENGRYAGFRCDADDRLGALRHRNPLSLSATFVRRAALLVVGMFDERLEDEADWDLWLKLYQHFGPGSFMIDKQPFCYHRRAEPGSLQRSVSHTIDGLSVHDYFRHRYGADPD